VTFVWPLALLAVLAIPVLAVLSTEGDWLRELAIFLRRHRR